MRSKHKTANQMSDLLNGSHLPVSYNVGSHSITFLYQYSRLKVLNWCQFNWSFNFVPGSASPMSVPGEDGAWELTESLRVIIVNISLNPWPESWGHKNTATAESYQGYPWRDCPSYPAMGLRVRASVARDSIDNLFSFQEKTWLLALMQFLNY